MREISVIITEEQAKGLCEHFHLNFDSVEDWQIGELVDKCVDEVCYGDDNC